MNVQRLQSGRPFEVLHGPILATAIDEVKTRFPADLAKSKIASRCHEDIAMALHAAAKRGDEPQLALQARDGGTSITVVKLGELLFPITVRELKWGEVAIELYPPRRARELDLKKGVRDGISGLYGEKADKLDRLEVRRGHGPTTHLTVKGGEKVEDISYAWALFEVAASLVRRATADKGPKQIVEFDPVLEQDVRKAAPKTPDARMMDALLAGGPRAAERPGPALAHDLAGAFSFRGNTIAVTSRRGLGEGMRLWVSGEQGWRALPMSDSDRWPVHGATPMLVGDRLHLFGGVNAKGEVLDSHFSVDLSRVEAPRADMVRRERDLGSPVAWAAAALEGREAFLGGGVAGFMVKAGERRERQKVMRQGFAALGQQGLRDRAPAPGDLTRSHALAHGGCVFFAPGDSRDGKVRIYDNTKGGAWITLPTMPLDVGLGQLFVVDRKLYYAGGFTAEGHPSSAIFEIDLSQPAPKWTKAGESPYCSGLARLVNEGGKVRALMITPAASRSFELGGQA